MSESPQPVPPKTGRNGGFLGGIIGILFWFNQPEDLLNVGKLTEVFIMVLFVGLCMLIGTTVERSIASRR